VGKPNKVVPASRASARPHSPHAPRSNRCRCRDRQVRSIRRAALCRRLLQPQPTCMGALPPLVAVQVSCPAIAHRQMALCSTPSRAPRRHITHRSHRLDASGPNTPHRFGTHAATATEAGRSGRCCPESSWAPATILTGIPPSASAPRHVVFGGCATDPIFCSSMCGLGGSRASSAAHSTRLN
jgi:hypothetical protein